ncbi:MAG: aminotransferase class V-fold PLP-dependent enzyme [Balneolaceae bacterium]
MSSPFQKSELTSIRNNFPHTQNGIYLNHAAISPLSLSVKQALNSFIDERHLSPIENLENSMELTEETRELISTYINAGSPDQITFMGNTSDAINAVAGGFNWQPGDEVILNTMEFPTNVQPFRILESKGVKIRYVPHQNHQISVESIAEFITPKTKMISISAVQFLGGFKADLKAIGSLCKKHDLYFVVDGIQALGATQIDVQEANIDALAVGSHKWMMAPMGLGILYLSKKLSSKLNPVKTGWLSVEEPWDLFNYDQKWQPVNQHLEIGTPNMLGIAGLNASIKTMVDVGADLITRQICYLTDHIYSRLGEKDTITLLTSADKKNRLGIVTFSVDQHIDYDTVVNELKKQGITISSREGFFRFSPHFYNTTEEIDSAIEAIFDHL